MSQTREANCKTFLEGRRGLILSTRSATNRLETSAVPFVFWDECSLLVLVSGLAVHTRNLLSLPEGEWISGLLVADESQSEELFARERLHLQCSVSEVTRDDDVWFEAMERFEARFGEVVGVLKTLPDFHCFRLQVQAGRYVCGFGEAYAFEGAPCKGLKRLSRA